jgi:drug/metabolite transporter (DMT)-like permease
MRQTDALVPERRATLPSRQIAVGIGCMVLAILLFTLMDSIAKTLTATYAVPQVVWGRYTFHLVVVLAWAPWLGSELVRTRFPIMQVGRGLLLAFATLCMVTALSFIPLADAYTVTFVAPLLVTVLSIPMLGERVSWRRWSAVIAGFVGVLIVLRPGLGVMHWAAALPLVTATCFALYQILTRIVSRGVGESPFAMSFYLALVGTLTLSALAPFFWRPIAPWDWLWLFAMGAFGATGHLLLIRALTLAPASLLAPFTYSQIVGALAIGYWIFGDLPDGWTLVGCAVIVASGLFVFYREAVLGRSS